MVMLSLQHPRCSYRRWKIPIATHNDGSILRFQCKIGFILSFLLHSLLLDQISFHFLSISFFSVDFQRSSIFSTPLAFVCILLLFLCVCCDRFCSIFLVVVRNLLHDSPIFDSVWYSICKNQCQWAQNTRSLSPYTHTQTQLNCAEMNGKRPHQIYFSGIIEHKVELCKN